jgi:serine/threonine-protein phosphatase PP1 catalytic subunit
MFNEVFDSMPIVSVIDDRIFCVHGGISPELNSIDNVFDIPRPIEVPEEGLLTDLLWSDPDPQVEWYEENVRGASWVFGVNPLVKFLRNNKFDLVVRAHQAVTGGFDFPFENDERLVTLFSAANYCYEYGNKGAMMEVDKNLCCSFHILEPITYDDPYCSSRPGTPPRGHESNLFSFNLSYGHN